jgi:glucose-6-phosphate isomerase
MSTATTSRPCSSGWTPRHTLFIVASKTFTTQETMANAHAARDWFLSQGGSHIEKHFAATTTNVKAAAEFGIHTTFGFWDWVGGRYSLWSAIGLPIAIAIGAANFRALLAGAHAMDRHFAQAPLAQNLPVLLGLLDVWYRNFHGFTSRSVAPYHQGLKRLPAYLQQLEMESNGKCVDVAGTALPYGTSPVVWGEPGTNGQHAYFQMLHQGTDVIPVEFIAVKTAAHHLADQHHKLLANCLAQSQALMLGKTAERPWAKRRPRRRRASTPPVLARHRSFPGNRPSTTLVLDALTPRSLGALIALYEHRVFTSGALWGINSFDQWGVELGKALCNQLLPRLSSGNTDGPGRVHRRALEEGFVHENRLSTLVVCSSAGTRWPCCNARSRTWRTTRPRPCTGWRRSSRATPATGATSTAARCRFPNWCSASPAHRPGRGRRADRGGRRAA